MAQIIILRFIALLLSSAFSMLSPNSSNLQKRSVRSHSGNRPATEILEGTTSALFLCYIWHPHGTKSGARAAKRPSVRGSLLSAVRVRGDGPTYVRRLRGRDLPALRHSARIPRRARHRIANGISYHPTRSRSCNIGNQTQPDSRTVSAGFDSSAGRRNHRIV